MNKFKKWWKNMNTVSYTPLGLMGWIGFMAFLTSEYTPTIIIGFTIMQISILAWIIRESKKLPKKL